MELMLYNAEDNFVHAMLNTSIDKMVSQNT